MISKDKEHPIKKLAMIELWRTQQISQPFSLVMLAITLALTLNAYIEWRFSNTYIGIIIALVTLVAIVLITGYLWDKVRMWHEQSVVGVERNPFNMHKMAPKEIIMYLKFHIPILAFISEFTKDDELKIVASDLKVWCNDQMTKDPNLRVSVDELLKQHFKGGMD